MDSPTPSGKYDILGPLVQGGAIEDERGQQSAAESVAMAAAAVEASAAALEAELDNARALCAAAAAGDTQALTARIKQGADMSWYDPMGFQAIHRAAEGGSVACVALLVAADATCVSSLGAKNRTPLHHACEAGNVEVVEVQKQRK